MNQKQLSFHHLAAVVAMTLSLASAPAVFAQGGHGGGSGGSGGSGGGGTTPTLYFINGADANHNANNMWSAPVTGGTPTLLGWFGNKQYPSVRQHGGKTWFVTATYWGGGTCTDGVTPRGRLIAYRQDWDSANNNSPSTYCVLLDDISLQVIPSFFKEIQWRNDDQNVTFAAVRWDEFGRVEGGLYSVDIVFDNDGNIVSGTNVSSSPILPSPLDSDLKPSIREHSWDTSGTRMVCRDEFAPGLWVIDLVTNTRTQISTRPNANNAEWSPAGPLITFTNNASVFTISPDGSGERVVASATTIHGTTWTNFRYPTFFPDGQSIACTASGANTTDIFTLKITGKNLTNVTNSPDLTEMSIGVRQ